MRLSQLMILIMFASPCSANVQDDMQNFFADMGVATNVTPGGAYKGQEGGFYTGGSLFSRNPTRDYQLFNIQVPGMSAGCGGIDIFTGGMGFIDSHKIVEMMKAIGANASGYLFSLGMKQISPQITNTIEEWTARANDANWNNINSCQAATKIVDSSIGYLQEAAKKSCMDKGLSPGGDDYGNYVNARHKCQDQREVNAKNREASKDSGLQDSVITDVNIVWRAIQTNPMLAALDDELKYLLMSLTGTVIITTQDSMDAPPKKQVLVSKLVSDDIINHLSTNKKFKVYACQDDHATAQGCLVVAEKEIDVTSDKTFVGQVREILLSMEKKALSDSPLDEKEKAFLESTTLPIYKMLNVHTAFTRGMPLMFVSDYADVIALDILYRYLDRGIGDVMQAYGNNLLPRALDEEFIRMITFARERIKELRNRQMQQLSTTYDMVAKVQMMEKQVSALVSTQMFNSMNWGRGVR